MTRQLHNGIPWVDEPVPVDYGANHPLPVPWLDAPPACIPIDIGRQLFVDDFLIEQTDLQRRFHAATTHPASPVLKPETPVELNGGHCPVAAPFNDGLWWDPRDRVFKMWYHAGWFDGTALALSDDGIHWRRPELDVVPGTNLVLAPPAGWMRDGCLVWLDDEAPDDERYKLFIYYRSDDGHFPLCYQSADGIHWGEPWQTSSGLGDNSGFYRDPFRARWVFSLRHGMPRCRARNESAHFREAACWDHMTCWARVDELDEPDPAIGRTPELYDLECAPYESLMLGAFCVFYGPQNHICAQDGSVKTIDMQLAFSRDGLHLHRPHREAFIASSREPGSWDLGYIHAVGGLCTVHEDQLWFHYTAFSGQSPKLAAGETGDRHFADNSMYAGASTGLATLRRDGFASMVAGEEGGELLTRPVRFSGRELFVNCDCPQGALRVTVCDEAGRPIAGYDSVALSVDSCKQRVDLGRDLAELAGRPLRFRFALRAGALYAFWVSADASGASRGWLAGGGPDYPGQRDI